MIDPTELKKLLKLMKREANYSYVFRTISSSDWIKPLDEKGFFKSPPAPIKEANGVRFPFWPESRYLARVADQAPKEVLRVALKIPETDNVRVHEDLAQAALAMPPNIAKSFLPLAKKWLKSQYFLLLPDTLGKLIAHLAQGGEINAALELTGMLLMPVKTELDADTAAYRGPDLRFRLWEYEQITSTYLFELTKRAPLKTFDLLCRLLDRSIELSLLKQPGRQDDGSYAWRELIHEDDQHETDVRNLLVTALRQAAEAALEKSRADLDKLMEILAKHKSDIFIRFQMYLLERFGSARDMRAAPLLISKTSLNNVRIQNEYDTLLRKRFTSLTTAEQLNWLALVEKGPMFHKNVPKAERKERSLLWKQRRLSPVIDKLPADWKKQHPKLIEGVTVVSDFRPFHMSGFTHVGPNSPIESEKIGRMKPEEVAEYIRQWTPGTGFSEPSPEGLSRVLSSDVKNRPGAYARAANKFSDLDPTYVRGYLQGIREAVDEGKSFPWKPVIGLMNTTVIKEDTPTRNWDNEESDPSWEWARKTVADVLFSATQRRAKKAELPIELRKPVWNIISRLTEDPNPTPEREAEFATSNRNAYDHLAINTVRGEAMSALMFYVMWVQRHFEAQDQEHVRTLNDAPEARAILEAHLDLKHDPSLAVRSVYGQWASWLQQADLDWFTRNVDRIFPPEKSLVQYWRVAWLAFIERNDAWPAVYVTLRKHYARALELDMLADKFGESTFYPQRLAAHLIVYYLSSGLNFGDEEKVLEKFFANAPDSMRAQAIDFAGDTLATIDEVDQPVAEERRKRLVALWENRLSVAQKDPERHREEMAAFGQWFVSGGIDDEWLETNLMTVLKVFKKIEPEFKVAERLAATAEKRPKRAIEILKLMIESPKTEWSLSMWQESARKVLATALSSGVTEAAKAAEDLLHELGAMGYEQFRDLARETSSQ